MTVTDELLEELEEAASNATQDAWELLPGTNLSGPEIIANGESIAWVLDSEADAVHIATANPANITALTAELRRLRAENAELAKDAGRYRAWEPIIDEVERRAGKECCIEHGCDFTVTVMHDDYIATMAAQ